MGGICLPRFHRHTRGETVRKPRSKSLANTLQPNWQNAQLDYPASTSWHTCTLAYLNFVINRKIFTHRNYKHDQTGYVLASLREDNLKSSALAGRGSVFRGCRGNRATGRQHGRVD